VNGKTSNKSIKAFQLPSYQKWKGSVENIVALIGTVYCKNEGGNDENVTMHAEVKIEN